ncbi:MAG: HAD family phosphatase [Nocardioidaceae bacterium]|nr:MAG: HAD family phosphatase [Nocardioidaceae bacterium]
MDTGQFTPKLVALDIDGTLFSAYENSGVVAERISPAVYDAVHRAKDAGAHIVLATGRSTFGITRVWDMLDLPQAGETMHTVASNGAVTFTYAPVDIVEEVTFDASQVVRELMTYVPHAIVAVEEIGVGYRVNRPFPEGEISGRITIQSIDELVAEPVTRVVIRDPDASAEEFIELAERLGLHGTNYFIGWTAWLDLAPEGISKASALQSVADTLGVRRSEVLAIGDGRNDIEMLGWAGRGVAMGHAPLEVQEAADFVTETVHNDGAAMELDRWF